MNQPIQLGILGAGLAVEHLHWQAIRHPDVQFEICAICDTDPQAAVNIAKLAGNSPPITESWDEFFAMPSMDAVLISLPIHLNAEALRASIRANKHVICEKPLAANLQQARELVNELRHTPVKILIAENFHYRDDLKQARRWLDEGAIGEPIILNMRSHFWADTSQGFSATRWRQDPQYRGSVVADAGVHHAAALHELGGSIERLQAFTRDIHPVLAGIDTMSLNIRFQSGLLGHISFCAAVQPAEPHFDYVTILGTEGSITIDRGTSSLLKPNQEPKTYTAQDSQGYFGEFRNFYRALTADEAIISTLEVALRDWEIIMYALDSAEGSNVIRC